MESTNPTAPADQTTKPYDYDLVVIGGGSGGIATAKEASKYGKKVALLDFVTPSPSGTKWGLGGTCVNVGCIPKKLMHISSMYGEYIRDSSTYGWELPNAPTNEQQQQESEGGEGEQQSQHHGPPIKHNWKKMMEEINNYVRSLNWGYKVQMRQFNINYINGRGSFVDPHTVQVTLGSGKQQNLTSERFVIAVGGRPKQLGMFEGSQHCITSDDIFWKEDSPGKTLVIGASYVALECAGFMTSLGLDTSLMVRSIFLRGFDQEMADMVGEHMKNNGTKIIRPAIPIKVEKEEGVEMQEDGTKSTKLRVTWESVDEGLRKSDVFDTVMLAIGRDPETKNLGLEAAGVKVNPTNGKIVGNNETTSVPHIHALGDVYEDNSILGPVKAMMELTPVAIQAGTLLARRLYGGSTQRMEYDHVPTNVFTPLEYGCVGLSEEDAKKVLGEGRVEVYHSFYKPLEWVMNHDPIRSEQQCYIKLVCDKESEEKVVGYHVAGPNSGEVVQGFALGLKLGAKKRDFDNLVGIHPTIAEEATTLTVTKGSGVSASKTGC